MVTKQEENKANIIGMVSSIAITGIIIFLLLLWTIHVKNPPFEPIPEIEGGGGGKSGPISVTFGTNEPGLGDYTMPKVTENSTPPPTNDNNASNIVTNDGVNINEVKNQNNNQTTNTQTHTQNNTHNQNQNNNNIHNWANNLNNANNSNGGNTGGTTGGVQGNPDGNPFGGSTGGSTTSGSTGGNNTGTTGGGAGGFGTGRKVSTLPCRVDDSNAEGIVVVIIKVNKNGDVIDADPNGSGTNTSNSVLKSKARQAAFCAKFEACSDCPEVSKGTIVFNFVFGGK